MTMKFINEHHNRYGSRGSYPNHVDIDPFRPLQLRLHENRANYILEWADGDNERLTFDEIQAMRRFLKEAIGHSRRFLDPDPFELTGGRFVYLMRNNRNGYTKVGCTKNLKLRESTLQAEDPDVELLWYFKGSYTEERIIHNRFEKQGKRIRGEWFRLDDEDIRSIKKRFRACENL
jgi:hypothetical protein